mgnify:CR=1 FL=1
MKVVRKTVGVTVVETRKIKHTLNENAVALTVSRSYLKEIIVRAKAIKSVIDY